MSAKTEAAKKPIEYPLPPGRDPNFFCTDCNRVFMRVDPKAGPSRLVNPAGFDFDEDETGSTWVMVEWDVWCPDCWRQRLVDEEEGAP